MRKELASIDADRGTSRRALLESQSKLLGRKVKAKYRDPKTGETWSGRGAAAGWMAVYEKAGRKRDEFLIDKPKSAAKRRKNKGAKKTRRKK